MRKIVFFAYTGHPSMDSEELVEVPDDYTNKELDEEAWLRAVEHAAMYGIYPLDDKPDDVDEDSEEFENYTDDIQGRWEEYDPEKHGELL